MKSLASRSIGRTQIICCLILAQLVVQTCVYGQTEPFVAIPPTAQTLYRFNFEKLFYRNEEARQNDLREYRNLKDQFNAIRSTATSSADKLLEALQLREKMGIVAERLWVYGGLRYSVNTHDTSIKEEGEKIDDDFETATTLLKIQVQALSDSQIQTFTASNPGLGPFRFLLQTWRRDQQHTGSENSGKAAGPTEYAAQSV